MPFAETYATKSTDETRRRSSTDYVKFVETHRTTLRILNNHARTIWKHWIPQANRGKGLSAVCPNSPDNMNVCPIEASGLGFPKDTDEYKNSRARRRYVVNVLDRTPWADCGSCGNPTPKTMGNKCISCKADTSKLDFKPLNKVKVLEGGPRLFGDALNPIQQMQSDELGVDITEYDIVFTTSGTGRDKTTTGLPREVVPFDSAWLIDPETNEPQKLYNLDDLAEPATIEELTQMMQGASFDDLLALREGVTVAE